jgi:hypothetical protein
MARRTIAALKRCATQSHVPPKVKRHPKSSATPSFFADC